jgi:hypothetical protein
MLVSCAARAELVMRTTANGRQRDGEEKDRTNGEQGRYIKKESKRERKKQSKEERKIDKRNYILKTRR